MSDLRQPPEPEQPQAIPSAPPTTPGRYRPRRPQAVWPAVLGIVCIVFSAFGLLEGAVGVLSVVMVALFSETHLAGIERSSVSAVQEYALSTLLASTGLLLAGGLLLAAGIGLLRRRRSGARLALIWAIAKVPLSAVEVWTSYLVQTAQMEAMASSGSPGGAPMAALMDSFVGGMMIVSLLWRSLLPLVMLVLLAIPAVKREVRTWQ